MHRTGRYIQTIIGANDMQHLLCIQDEQVKRLKGEALKARATKIQADKLVVESLQKEITLGKDLETLCNKTTGFSEVRRQRPMWSG